MLQTIQATVAGAIVIATTTLGMVNTPSVLTIIPTRMALEGSKILSKEALAQEVAKPPVLETKAQMEQFLKKYATEKGVSYEEAHFTITCESNWNPKIQSAHVKNGVREDSWGLVQIHLPSHKNITKEQALDPEFSIRFLVDNFASGDAKLWTCWRNYYNKVK